MHTNLAPSSQCVPSLWPAYGERVAPRRRKRPNRTPSAPIATTDRASIPPAAISKRLDARVEEAA